MVNLVTGRSRRVTAKGNFSVGLVVALTLMSSMAVGQQSRNFVLDRGKPFVWVQFDHAGTVKSGSDGKSVYYWLRLNNNCVQPVQVTVNGRLSDALAGEESIQYSSEDNPPKNGISADAPDLMLPSDERPALAKNPGYGPLDVGSRLVISPGQSALFRVPSDVVGSSWHLRIDVSFADTYNGPTIPVVFHLSEVPESQRAPIDHPPSR